MPIYMDFHDLPDSSLRCGIRGIQRRIRIGFFQVIADNRSFREMLTVFGRQCRYFANGADGKPILTAAINKAFLKGNTFVEEHVLDDVVIVTGCESVQGYHGLKSLLIAVH